MGATVFVPYVLLALAFGARWRHRSAVAGPVGGARVTGASLAFARIAHEDEPPRRYPVSTSTPSLPVRRTFWARVKIWIGSAGLLVCGPWWLLLVTMLFMPDPAPALDGLFTNYSLTLVTISLLLTMLFLVFLRSGLRGPSDPFAPTHHPHERLRDQPYVPHAPGVYAGPGPRAGKKSHLRLVRNTP
ncbi:hypothetical protein F0U60_27595 [Archangium minus]|uniref:Uncharacterized protein n=1 Tax=Archangium minus TaxID=83450 RepID=A0ABY9WWE0_9BACT|nr:hypothetical protein F0U60_27595 [Archangium minus]